MLGEALRLIRVYHDLKQTEAAERLCVSSSYLSEIEKGKKEPSLDVLRRYSEVFQVPVSSILFFSESKGQAFEDRLRANFAGKIISLMRFIEQKST